MLSEHKLVVRERGSGDAGTYGEMFQGSQYSDECFYGNAQYQTNQASGYGEYGAEFLVNPYLASRAGIRSCGGYGCSGYAHTRSVAGGSFEK